MGWEKLLESVLSVGENSLELRVISVFEQLGDVQGVLRTLATQLAPLILLFVIIYYCLSLKIVIAFSFKILSQKTKKRRQSRDKKSVMVLQASHQSPQKLSK